LVNIWRSYGLTGSSVVFAMVGYCPADRLTLPYLRSPVECQGILSQSFSWSRLTC